MRKYPRSRETTNCVMCDKPFLRKAGGNSGKCCSRSCGFDYLRKCREEGISMTVPKYVDFPRPPRTCVRCEKVFSPKSRQEVHTCSQQCSNANRKERPRTSLVECQACLSVFERRSGIDGPNPSKYCSMKCVQAGRDASDSFNGAVRRMREKSAKVGRIVRCEVYKRDNYQCGICGEQVDMTLPPRHKMGATVDHLIPLSKGGTHSYENVQCAHRSCNSRKHASTDYAKFCAWW